MLASALCCALGLALTAAPASADIIAKWTFETSHPNDNGVSAGPYAPETGSSSFEARRYIDNGTPVANHDVVHAGSWSFGANRWTTESYYQFKISTTDYEDIALDWYQARNSASTHSNLWDLRYSLNGTTWVTLVDNYSVATGSAWTHLSYDLSAVTAIEDQTWVTFRLVDNGAAHSNSVNVWVDDFQVSGTLIPEPGTMALLGIGLGLLALRRRR